MTNIVSSELQSLPVPLGRSVRPPYVYEFKVPEEPYVYVPDEHACQDLRDWCFILSSLTIFIVLIGFYIPLWCIIYVGYLVALLFHLVSCGYLFRFVEFHYCSCCLLLGCTADLGGADGMGYPNGQIGVGGLCCLLSYGGGGVVIRDGEFIGGGGGGGYGDGGGGGDGGCGGGGDGGGGGGC